MEQRKPQVIAIVGPTASGKSAVADHLAQILNTVVVSADAMQVYRRMDIGTAKTPVDQRPVPLECVDIADIDKPFSVALYQKKAREIVDRELRAVNHSVLCGGTGLYINAVIDKMDFTAGTQVDNSVRIKYEKILEEQGPEALHKLLRDVDPGSAEILHPNNTRRVIRAFEMLAEGTSYVVENSKLHSIEPYYNTKLYALKWDRKVLYERINARVDTMIELGLLDEVQALIDDGFADSITSCQAIGYKEFIDVLTGDKPLDVAIEEVKRSSRRYAKRQLTWFRRDSRIQWLDPTSNTSEELAMYIAKTEFGLE